MNRTQTIVLILFFVILFLILVTAAVFIRFLRSSTPKPTNDFSASITTTQVSVENKSTAQDYFNCNFDLISKGDQIAYTAFFSPFTLKVCDGISKVKQNYDCRLSNWVKKYKDFESATTIEKLEANGIGKTIIALDSFYLKSTSPDQSFTHDKTSEDAYSIVISCRQQDGVPVMQEILFSP